MSAPAPIWTRIAGQGADELAFYEREISEGRMQCAGVYISQKRAGTMLVSWLREDDLVFVCNALAIDPVKGFDTIPELLELANAWAASRGAAIMRFWTLRPGLVKATEALGFTKKHVMEAPTNGR